MSAYWRYVRWQIESRLRHQVVVDWVGGAKLAARNGMTGATGNIYCGLHEFTDMAFLLHLLRPGDVFVDVGANIGSYTTLASAVCGAHSMAVEPDPETASFLKANVEINKISERVVIFECAVGASSGTVEFTIGQDTTNKVADGTTGLPTRIVQVRSLDQIVEGTSPTLIKLDVEGYEPQVFEGAHDTLRRSSLLAVITETENLQIHSLLAGNGFVRASYDPFTRTIVPCESVDLSSGSNNALYARLDEIGDRLVTAVKRRVVGVSF